MSLSSVGGADDELECLAAEWVRARAILADGAPSRSLQPGCPPRALIASLADRTRRTTHTAIGDARCRQDRAPAASHRQNRATMQGDLLATSARCFLRVEDSRCAHHGVRTQRRRCVCTLLLVGGSVVGLTATTGGSSCRVVDAD